MTVTTDIVAKLWRLCDILRDDGITYHEYVTELTYLLFLKMMAETGRQDQLPEGKRWADLLHREGMEQLTFYKHLLLDLGTNGRGLVQAIFADAQSRLKKPTNLKALVEAIDGLDWFSAREEGLGSTCPECDLDAFVLHEGKCVYCEFDTGGAECAICGEPISIEDYANNSDFCGYHAWVALKDD